MECWWQVLAENFRLLSIRFRPVAQSPMRVKLTYAIIGCVPTHFSNRADNPFAEWLHNSFVCPYCERRAFGMVPEVLYG